MKNGPIRDTSIITTLLNAQARHQLVKLFSLDMPSPLGSAILGFDYYESTLLLDGITPAIDAHSLASLCTTPFWVQLKAGNEWLKLHCLVLEHRYDLFTLKILSYELSDNQRWYPRITFTPRKGPQVSVDIPHELPARGHVRNLSVHGALVEFYGDNLRDRLQQGRRYPCNLQFNEFFEVPLHAQARQVAYTRKGASHTALRLVFTQQDAVSYNQLDNFIHAFESGEQEQAIFGTKYGDLSQAAIA